MELKSCTSAGIETPLGTNNAGDTTTGPIMSRTRNTSKSARRTGTKVRVSKKRKESINAENHMILQQEPENVVKRATNSIDKTSDHHRSGKRPRLTDGAINSDDLKKTFTEVLDILGNPQSLYLMDSSDEIDSEEKRQDRVDYCRDVTRLKDSLSEMMDGAIRLNDLARLNTDDSDEDYSTTVYNRCHMVEHVIESIKVACSNCNHGCTARLNYYQKEDHEKGCPHAPCFCPEAGCSFSGPTMNLLGHLTGKHNWHSAKATYKKAFGIRFQVGSIVLVGEDGHLFLVKMTLEPLGGVIKIFCVQPHITGSKFKCNLTFSRTESRYSQATEFLMRSTNLHDGLPKDCLPFALPNVLLWDTSASAMAKVGAVFSVVLTPQ